MFKKYLLTSCLLILAVALWAQSDLPLPSDELMEKPLRQWIKTNWYDGHHVTLGYNGATGVRGRMYNYIDNYDNTITGVYSGYTVTVTYGGTRTNPQPINCEHTVPQSFFGEAEPMKSDLYHLFPSYGNWNSTRSNYPFDEIDDMVTNSWMRLSTKTNKLPVTNIDEYSEYTSSGGSRFEPREDHKGNVARAIFYFYTMYEDYSQVKKDITQVADLDDLMTWHHADPVDQKELDRNNRGEIYQGNRNPYVDHPEWAERAWVKENSGDKALLTNVVQPQEALIYPNPFEQAFMVKVEGAYQVLVYSLFGTLLIDAKGNDHSRIDCAGLPAGLYQVNIRQNGIIRQQVLYKRH